jgi:Zn-dependent M28 family amino/carboxypeptidase
LSLAAGVLGGRGRLRGTSPGARDNGTGLFAALLAAERCADPSVGFLFTGAEEFGLVGARAFLRDQGTLGGAEVLNLDTITDRGALYLVAHDARGRTLAEELLPLLRAAAPRVVVRRLPLGILTDSLPMARSGSPAVTLARLDWADLGRLHTPRDTVDDLGLDTAEAVGRAVGGLPRPAV